ncbi:MAG: MFS transporter, partial [Anaerolineales bacterium]
TSTFTPKFFHDQGVSPTIYGLIVAVFMGGSAIGGVLGGVLGDRWGQRRTITLMMGLGVLPFYFLPLARGGWIYPVATLAGLFNGAPHSVLVTLAQRALPGRSALASGITLGFMFTAGALGAYLSGLAADRLGLTLVLQGNAVLALLATLLSLTLQLDRERFRVVVAPDSPLPAGEGQG